MGRIPQPLRETIARNIRAERMRKFPGRGGSKHCAEAFSTFIDKNVSPQQWSPWERGMRTPDETRLEQIAAFFGKTVEYMRRDNRPPVPGAPSHVNSSNLPQHGDDGVAAVDVPAASPAYAGMSTPELIIAMGRDQIKAVYQVEIAVTGVRFIPRGDGGNL